MSADGKCPKFIGIGFCRKIGFLRKRVGKYGCRDFSVIEEIVEGKNVFFWEFLNLLEFSRI